MVGFVDDTTIYVNNFYKKHTSVGQLVTMLRSDTQLWSNLLWTTGGELESSKCTYSLSTWLFDFDRKPQLTHPSLGYLPIRNHSSNQIATIKYCNPDTATKYLGHYKALSGNQSKQLEVPTTKTNQ